jgi:hypothetical protein
MELLLEEKRGNYMVQVFHDWSVDPMDLIDPSSFENDKSLKEYMDKFKNEELSIYCVMVKKFCDCCEQLESEILDSLGGIEEESPEKAMDYYITSYAPDFIQDACV